MNEIKNIPFFHHNNQVPHQYPWLSHDEECEVLVLGGGVTGCFAAHTLAKNGVDVVLLTDRPVGYSSSCIDSSTLCYQNELMLTSLSDTIGRDQAVSCFQKCGGALDTLETLAQGIDNFDFARRDSFLYTDCPEKVNDLHAEYLMRKHNGFQVEFLEKADARELFSFEVQAGILSRGGGGEADSYKLCHALLASAQAQGVRIYENSPAEAITDTDDGVLVTTDNQRQVKANKIVFALGYKQDEYLHHLTGKRTAFFAATVPMERFWGYESKAVSRNISSNVSLRATADGRVIISGLDCSLIDQKGKLGKLFSIDRLVSRKYAELSEQLKKMLCGIGQLEIDYQYHGTYGTTRDGLPIIGEHLSYDNTYFDMPTSINGILYSIIGGDIITGLYLGGEPETLFSPNRITL